MALPTAPSPGSRVIVTGAAGGMGRAITAHLAEAGCRLALCDLVTVDDLAPSVAPQVVHQARLDLADTRAIAEGVTALVESLGGCDAVVGNAGVVDPLHRAERFPIDAWERDLTVNLTGQFAVVQAAFPALADSGDGRVVLVSSTAAETGLPGQAAYAASKAGLVGFARTLAVLGQDLGDTPVGSLT